MFKFTILLALVCAYTTQISALQDSDDQLFNELLKYPPALKLINFYKNQNAANKAIINNILEDKSSNPHDVINFYSNLRYTDRKTVDLINANEENKPKALLNYYRSLNAADQKSFEEHLQEKGSLVTKVKDYKKEVLNAFQNTNKGYMNVPNEEDAKRLLGVVKLFEDRFQFKPSKGLLSKILNKINNNPDAEDSVLISDDIYQLIMEEQGKLSQGGNHDDLFSSYFDRKQLFGPKKTAVKDFVERCFILRKFRNSLQSILNFLSN